MGATEEQVEQVARVGPLAALRADLAANRGKPREMLIVALLRLAQAARERSRLLGVLCTVLYRLVVEVGLNVELRPETKVGPGLRLFHCTGIVVETGVVLGANVKLHQNVTIGRASPTSGVPVVGDDVSFGVGAIALGGITIGEGSFIGAGAVVTRDVPPRHIVKAAEVRVEPLR